ncbi:hypothetical protein DFJ74DRAFT_710971 [Hyaloraphidium curvatum]|nr:hypothetical protein DFJ74DRAFT_710971 [Hyaloraphidium curvatum]
MIFSWLRSAFGPARAEEVGGRTETAEPPAAPEEPVAAAEVAVPEEEAPAATVVESPIPRLPPEVLGLIVKWASYVTRIQPTPDRISYRNLARGPSLQCFPPHGSRSFSHILEALELPSDLPEAGAGTLFRRAMFNTPPPEAARFLSMAPNLVSLVIFTQQVEYMISDDVMLAAATCTSLRSLELGGIHCHADVLRDSLSAMASLESLTLYWYGNASSLFFNAVAYGVPPGLKAFSLRPNTKACHPACEESWPEIRNAHLAKLCERVASLERLQLRHCKELTDASVGPALARHAELKFLDLSGCHAITDVSLARLEACDMSVLSITGLDAVTDVSVAPILSRSSAWTAIDLAGTAATDALVSLLRTRGAELRYLSISDTNCTTIPEEFLRTAKHLEHLGLGVRSVNARQVEALRSVPLIRSLTIGTPDGPETECAVLGIVYAHRATLERLCVDEAGEDLVDALAGILDDRDKVVGEHF